MISVIGCKNKDARTKIGIKNSAWQNVFVVTESCTHPDIQNMQLQSDVGLILSEDLDAVDMAEVGQKSHQVGAGIDDVADAVTRADQQRHLCLFLTLLQKVAHV